MLLFDFVKIGNKLYDIRKKLGMTQSDIAEAAEISDRTYADIERGTVNMRVETILKICNVMGITPDEILVERELYNNESNDILQKIDCLSSQEKKTALSLLSVYIESLEKQ